MFLNAANPAIEKDIEDHLAQLGQRYALRLLEGIEVLVDLLSRHDPIVLIDEPGGQGAQPGQQSVAADWAVAGRRLHLPDELTRQIDQVAEPLRWGQVSAQSHARQQGQPEENDMDRVPAPPSAAAGQ